MYMPKLFRETNPEKILDLLQKNPLGTLVVNHDNEFEVNHIPFVVDINQQSEMRLRAHIPRSNSLSNLLACEQSCVVVFHGAEGYISPSWYATKKEHGKVIPTWNYSVVHVHGKIAVRDDSDWVLRQINDLTQLNESKRSDQWAVSDAPDDFIARQITMLVGLELMATKVEGKTKASQNQPKTNQKSVLKSLQLEQPGSELHAMVGSALPQSS